MSFKDANPETPTTASLEDLKAKLASAQAGSTKEPEPEEAVATAVVVAADVENPFQMAVPTSGGMDAVDAMLAVAEQGTSLGFPTLGLTGGNTGGNFKAASFVKDEVADEMPEGGKAFPCVFLGYRVACTGWKHKFGEGDDKEKPAFNVAAGHVDPENIKQITLAAKNYQFTGAKGKFDYDVDDEDSPAHVRPQLELLVYDPVLDNLMVVETCSHFTSMTETMKQLRAYAQVDAESGARVYRPFPCKFKGVSKDNSNGKFKWKTHWIEIDGDTQKSGKELKKLWDDYQVFIDAAMQDQELRANVTAWMACTDRPMTAQIKANLEATEAV